MNKYFCFFGCLFSLVARNILLVKFDSTLNLNLCTF